MPSLVAMPLRAARFAWVPGVLVGGAALWWRAAPHTLAPFNTCTGIVDLLAIGVLRLLPSLSVGVLLTWLDRLALVSCAAAFSSAALAWGAHPLLTGAAALALILSPPLAPLLAIPYAPLVIACALAAIAAVKSFDRRRAQLAAVGISAAAMAAIAPALGLPLTLLLAVAYGAGFGRSADAGPSQGRDAPGRSSPGSQGRAALASVAGPLLASVVTTAIAHAAGATDSWNAALQCLRPGFHAPSMVRLRSIATAVAADASPLIFVLAALAVLGAHRPRSAWLRGSAVALVGLASWAIVPSSDTVATAPILAMLWVAASVAATHVAGRSVIVLCLAVLLLPWLQASDTWRSARDEPAPISLGHERWTLRAQKTITGAIPGGSAIVDEEAIAALLRAAEGNEARARKGLDRVPLDAASVASRLVASPVFALPLAQQTLQDRGFVLAPARLPVRDDRRRPMLQSLARVVASRPCAPLETSWRDVTREAGDRLVDLVADDDRARGPIVMYAGGPDLLVPAPYGWSRPATRGFLWRRFDRARPEDAAALKRYFAAERVPPSRGLLDARHVVKLEVWRTPDAPLALPIRIGPRVEAAVARVQQPPPAGTLSLCPSIGHEPVAASR